VFRNRETTLLDQLDELHEPAEEPVP